MIIYFRKLESLIMQNNNHDDLSLINLQRNTIEKQKEEKTI